MEFNEQFYYRLFKLTASKKESSLAEIRKIVQDVTAYYVANGITELWQNLPGDDIIRQDSASSDTGSRRFDKEKPMPPLKKDLLLSHDVSAGQYLKPSPVRMSASPNVHTPVIEKKHSNEFLDSFSSAADTSVDSESIRFVQNIKSDADAESSWPMSVSVVKAEDDSIISSPVSTTPTIKRSFSNEESSKTSYLSDPPPPKQRKIDDQTRRSIEKSSVKSETSSPIVEQPRSLEDSFGGGLFCVVCNEFSNPSGNRVVECHECHNLYHQKCHDPNIPQSQIDDPRLLWYCSGCNKKLKKSSNTNPKSSNQSSSSKVHAKESNKEKIKPNSDSNLKRIDSKDKNQSPAPSSVQDKMQEFMQKHKNKTGTQLVKQGPTSTSTALPPSFLNPASLSSVSSTSVLSGLAGLGKLATTQPRVIPSTAAVSGLGKLQQIAAAASVNSPLKVPPTASTMSSTSSAISTSSSHKTPNFSSAPTMQAAEKRLQQMKKKAASKSSFIK